MDKVTITANVKCGLAQILLLKNHKYIFLILAHLKTFMIHLSTDSVMNYILNQNKRHLFDSDVQFFQTNKFYYLNNIYLALLIR